MLAPSGKAISRVVVVPSVAAVGCGDCALLRDRVSPHAQAADKQQKLEAWLRRFPDRRHGQGGKLTIQEAQAYIAAPRRSAGGTGRRRERQGGREVARRRSARKVARYTRREFKNVPYRLLKPIDLGKNPDQKYPMILSLHGAGGNRHATCEPEGMVRGDGAGEWRRKHPCAWWPRRRSVLADTGHTAHNTG